MQPYRYTKGNISQIRTGLHVSAYSSIFMFVEIRRNCCAFPATAKAVFVFRAILNQDNVIPPPMQHALASWCA
jgi:hypothetical protein